MSTGESRGRLFALLAVLALLLGLGLAVPPSSAVAAESGPLSALAGENTAATIADHEFHNCLDSDYEGHVYSRPCAPDRENYTQQWQAVGKTLVNVQTGLCLDGNAEGRIYTMPCDPNQRNPYQEWQSSTVDRRVIFNPKTERFLSADPPQVISGAYLGFDRQRWTITPVDGACTMDPLTMVIDEVLPDKWYDFTPTFGSPDDIGGRWTMSVTEDKTRSESVTWSQNWSIEYGFDKFKASASGGLSKGTTVTSSMSVTLPFSIIVPRGQKVWTRYGVNKHAFTFHWHRSSKDCRDLNSGPQTMEVPFEQKYHWNCDESLDRDCHAKVVQANPTPAPGGGGAATAGAGSGAAAQEDFPSITEYVYDPQLRPDEDPGPNPPAPKATTVTYTGPRSAPYHAPFTASARVTSADGAVTGGTVRFTLGGASCTTVPGSSGNAACQLTPVDAPGTKTLQISYSGTAKYEPSSTSVDFTILKLPTDLRYTGVKRVANAEPGLLSADLTEGETGVTPVQGRTVQLALGEGTARQSCTAATDERGTARCTIASVDQPLNAEATVPVTADFAGDAYYLGSRDAAEARLEHYTGQATGLSGSVRLPLVSLSIAPTPDTGPVRTAKASRTDTPCAASAGTLLVSAGTLCPEVTTSLAPGTSRATSEIEKVRIGLPGVPVIEISGVTAESRSTCAAATGSATLTLRVAGAPVTVPTAPNSTVELPGGGRITVNEQSPTPGADTGLKVTAAHVVVPGLTGNLVDLTVGTAVSGAHNCR
ncbi:choice-of-anchor P family protein [Streptomyces sp. NPDC088762]|uniref:choice-of-anchor P family protein n=1 Tax=Streptomyces sp. NPDC088762 TaxID=3365891 RepID=UPI003820AB9D